MDDSLKQIEMGLFIDTIDIWDNTVLRVFNFYLFIFTMFYTILASPSYA